MGKECPTRTGSQGPHPGSGTAAAGSQSPTKGRQTTGRQLDREGSRPWSQQAGEERPTRTGRQGLRFGAAAGLRPNSPSRQPLSHGQRSIGSGPRYQCIRFCRTFLHVAQVRKHTDMREMHAKCKNTRTCEKCTRFACILRAFLACPCVF